RIKLSVNDQRHPTPTQGTGQQPYEDNPPPTRSVQSRQTPTPPTRQRGRHNQTNNPKPQKRGSEPNGITNLAHCSVLKKQTHTTQTQPPGPSPAWGGDSLYSSDPA